MPLFNKIDLERREKEYVSKLAEKYNLSVDEARQHAYKHINDPVDAEATMDKPDTEHEDDEKLEDVEELKDVDEHQENEEPEPVEEDEEGFEENEEDDLGFNISDHLSRIKSLLDLLQNDMGIGGETGMGMGNGMGIGKLIHQMLNPEILENVPFADTTLTPEHHDKLDKVKGKMVMMVGDKDGDRPLEIKKKVLDIGDENSECEDDECQECDHCDDDNVDDVVEDVNSTIEAMSNIYKKNVFASEIKDTNEYVVKVKKAFDLVTRCADNSSLVNEHVIGSILKNLNYDRFIQDVDTPTRVLVSGVISDLVCYDKSEEFFRNIADRLRVAYHTHMEVNDLSDKTMVKSAFYEVKEDGQLNKGFNLCPKYKSVKGVEIPVAWDFCHEACIESKVESSGKVTCKFANWLETVADSHNKAMNKLDVHVNPVNKDMALRLPDGEKEFKPRGYMKTLEQRLEEADIRGRSWDDLKSASKVKSGAAGKMLSLESLLDEILEDKDIHRDDSNNDKTYEEKLRDSSKSTDTEKTFEQRMYNKDIKKAEKEDGNIEKKLGNTEIVNFDTTKLFDELLEEMYPRKDEQRPQGE